MMSLALINYSSATDFPQFINNYHSLLYEQSVNNFCVNTFDKYEYFFPLMQKKYCLL